MVLILLPHSRQITNDFQIQLPQPFLRPDARPLQDLRGAECAATQHNHLAGADDGLPDFTARDAVAGGHIGDADGFGAFEDNAGYFSVGAEVEVALGVHDAVHVGCYCRGGFE